MGTFCGFWHLGDCLTSRTLTLLGCLVDAQQGHSISCRRISHLTKLEMIIIIMLRSSILLWELRGASKEGEERAWTGGGGTSKILNEPSGCQGAALCSDAYLPSYTAWLHTMEYLCMLGPTSFENILLHLPSTNTCHCPQGSLFKCKIALY